MPAPRDMCGVSCMTPRYRARVVPLFVLDPALLGPAGAPRTAFLLRSLRALDADLRKHGPGLVVRAGRPEDVVRTRQYLVDAADADAVGRAHGRWFGDIRPASTMLVVGGLLRPEWRVEIEAEAIVDDRA